ncbi:glycosyltransferase [Rhodohalobacter sulfatireducens]|uniref:Glycosyl transferase family 28 C-terminal domain-containing protein n=1 Tax=Rhodohalobacter sulfatireducens TaxID=2911366 RepID=A0ABS9KIJ5_9BACT|nr:hypothetical protein [Rhodohalobacter sulfatireducens]
MLILTEAGKNIGLGHFIRCSAIADRLHHIGLDVELAVDWRGESDINSSFQPFSWDELNEVLNSAGKYKCCLVDSYLAGDNHFKQIANHFDSVVVIDDYHRRHSFNANMVINPNIYGDKIEYGHKSIGGPDYIILRKKFKSHIKQREVEPNISNIGISVGGNDYRKILPKLIASLSSTHTLLHVFCGDKAYKEEIETKFQGYEKISCYGFLEAAEVAGVLNKVDVMVSGGGQSLHELAYAGIPTIVICIDKDQDLNINAYLETGFLTEKNNWDDSNLTKNVLRQIDDLKPMYARKELSNIGKQLVDGKGVDRIVNIIKKFEQSSI